MVKISEAFDIAIQHHGAGRLDLAEEIYRRILALAPDNADALHLLGVVAHQLGKHDIAAEYIARAIRLNGTDPVIHSNLGAVLSSSFAHFEG